MLLTDRLLSFSPRLDNKIFYTFYSSQFQKLDTLTLKQLIEGSQKIAFFLSKHYQEQKIIALVFPPGLELVQALAGCLFANMIPVLCYPPIHQGSIQHFESAINDCTPVAYLCSDKISMLFRSQRSLRKLKWLPGIEKLYVWLSKQENEQFRLELGKGKILPFSKIMKEAKPFLFINKPKENDIAFLQYTSGSTRYPRGVIVTHENLVQNLAMIKEHYHNQEDVVAVSWLPPYHDMGLIGMIFSCMFSGNTLHYYSPTDFVLSPLEWLYLMSKTKATHTAAPNFAFELCVRRARTNGLKDLDLSSVRCAICGAEPTNAQTMRDFVEMFAPYGFNSKVLIPSYGLAEATLMSTCGDLGTGYRTIFLDKAGLGEQKVQFSSFKDDNAIEFVSCGKARCKMKVVEPNTLKTYPEDEIGEILLSGPSITRGYYNKAQETEDTYILDEFGNRWLRTGDLGLIHENELYVTGRIKDLIILGGKNYYPHDIEFTAVKAHSQLKLGSLVAFSDEHNGHEELCIVCGFKNPLTQENAETVANSIREEVLRTHFIPVTTVSFISNKQISRTPSGKLRRQHLKKLMKERTVVPTYSQNY